MDYMDLDVRKTALNLIILSLNYVWVKISDIVAYLVISKSTSIDMKIVHD